MWRCDLLGPRNTYTAKLWKKILLNNDSTSKLEVLFSANNHCFLDFSLGLYANEEIFPAITWTPRWYIFISSLWKTLLSFSKLHRWVQEIYRDIGKVVTITIDDELVANPQSSKKNICNIKPEVWRELYCCNHWDRSKRIPEKSLGQRRKKTSYLLFAEVLFSLQWSRRDTWHLTVTQTSVQYSWWLGTEAWTASELVSVSK